MKSNVTYVLSFSAAVIASSLFAGSWIKGEKPVLGDKRLGTCFDVNVVTNGPAPYTMYFSWRPQKSIALVRSDDAVKWTQEPEICLRENPKSGWEDMVNRSCTVKKDGIWHMWYTGQSKKEKMKGRIGYARSKDGVRFERVQKDPVLTASESYEKPSVMNPYVIWDDERGLWRMWYAAGGTYEPDRLCYAESKDGLNWEKHGVIFKHGSRQSWYRDRVAACEVHRLPDGRYVMFFIGYPDLDTAHIGCAISSDGIRDWKVLDQSPIIIPDIGTWDSCACYKPSAVRDEKRGKWMLWYNGRSGGPEYIGYAEHEGLDLEASSEKLPDTEALLSQYVKRFNVNDDECVKNAIPNSAAEKFLSDNIPRFACPDREIERTYYFRWWTFRKHLRKGKNGGWRVTEFLPSVGWSGVDNTIVCAAGHHFREGRWLRDPQYLVDNARFWLSDKDAVHRWLYSSWIFTGTCLLAEVSGLDNLPVELLDDAVKFYEKWEKGVPVMRGKFIMGGDGQGGFRSVDGHEGTELSLGGNGWKPLFNSAMWSEAKNIAEVARKAGRTELAGKFESKADRVCKALKEKCWNDAIKFFTTRNVKGGLGEVRELHGYAPWYFGVPVEGCRPDWEQLFDEKGFAALYGLTFPERRAKGFALAYKGHECQWNGPSWPFATSVAITAYANDLRARGCTAEDRERFAFLMWQYAFQHKLHRTAKNPVGSRYDPTIPWIDENFNPDTTDWIARTLLIKRKQPPRERGKDYNHSTFCDLVISGLVGFKPEGAEGFSVEPLFPKTWDYCILENLKYRGHEVSIVWHRGKGGLTVKVDGRVAAKSAELANLKIRSL